MVLQKRLDYGFNGYQVPPIPRAARSARRRCMFKKKADDNQQMCAFDLLATVAGKLLSDGENNNTSSRKDIPARVKDPVCKVEEDIKPPLDEKSSSGAHNYYERNFLFTELVSEQNDAISRPASGITTSDCSEKVNSAEQLVNDDCKLRLGIFTPSVDFYGSENESRKETKKIDIANNNIANNNNNNNNSNNNNNTKTMSIRNASEGFDRKPSGLVCSVDNSVKFPFCKNPVNNINNNNNNGESVNLVNRDDDDNFSERARNKAAALKSPPRVGDRRFRKLQHCAERSNYVNRKNNSKRQRSLRDYPFKKRKLYECSGSVSNSDEGNSSGGIHRQNENGTKPDGIGSGPTLPEVAAPPTLTSVAGGYVSFRSRNSQVKLKIKSFRVPELFIEIPETATVGSLKRTVMEAVNAVLGGGLRVGVVVQGKKIRDDNKTLLQTGISHDSNNSDNTLGFTLEPSPAPPPLLQSSYPESKPLPRYLAAVNNQQGNNNNNNNVALDTDTVSTPSPAADVPGSSFSNFMESDYDSAPSHSRMSLSESKALVPLCSTKQDALAVVPFRKSKRSESVQRRIRRPFTVAEVEALVQAVEKLGTGRWRDVKLRAFDSAKHRTYVDLKDKWKTLVHTARISPQQRRGEPVPQELLDRVLTAHAYWSQQQAKQQLKSHPDTCLLL